MRIPLLFFVLSAVITAAAEVSPLKQAHAHNDYEHARPLLDALDRGFCSVEADIYLVEGKLLVAHDRKNVTAERTLAALYLEPLRDRIQRNGGRVFGNAQGLVLLVDIKSEAEPTYAALHDELARFAGMLTRFSGEGIRRGAVTVIVSGNRPVETMRAQPLRYAAIDGRKEDLEANPPAALIPLVSENWKKVFSWNWEGAMPADVSVALREWVNRAHTQGRNVRFWNTPDRAEAWTALLDAGVDVIGTDDLDGLQRFLLARR